MRIGIDVSSHQGKINWDKVVGSTAYNGKPIDFVIFRGFIGSDAAPTNTKFDTKFQEYFYDFMEACDKVKRTPGVNQPNEMKYGFYIIPYAMSTDKALLEAKKCLELLNGMHIYPKDADMGLWYDAEGEGGKGFSNLASLSKVQVGDICDTFCKAIDQFGWKTGIYCNRNWTKNEIDKETLDTWPLWLAAYTNSGTYTETKPAENPVIWQFTSKGKVEGVNTNCDVNVCYDEWWT